MPKGVYPRKPTKINPDKVKELIKAGIGPTDIAKHQGVNPSTIFRFLSKNELEAKAISYYRANRADLFASLQCGDLELHSRIVHGYLGMDDETISALPHSAKIGLLNALNISFGTEYDKERLEQGLSTQNISYADALKVRQQLLDERQALEG